MTGHLTIPIYDRTYFGPYFYPPKKSPKNLQFYKNPKNHNSQNLEFSPLLFSGKSYIRPQIIFFIGENMGIQILHIFLFKKIPIFLMFFPMRQTFKKMPQTQPLIGPIYKLYLCSFFVKSTGPKTFSLKALKYFPIYKGYS